MITRNRRERFYQAETELQQLVAEDSRSIKRCYSLYGPYDLVIPIEAETLTEVHQAVEKSSSEVVTRFFPPSPR